MVLELPEAVYWGLIQHLLPKDENRENLAFVYADLQKTGEVVKLTYRDWLPISSSGFASQLDGFIQLSDETKSEVIKKAFRTGTCLVEFHSHPFASHAGFSWTDLEGLEEFVPYVMWRLKGRPYAAVVMARGSFDGLVWIDNPGTPHLIGGIRVGERLLQPSGLTLRNRREFHERDPV